MKNVHVERIQEIIDSYIEKKGGNIELFDVGCGSSIHFKFPPVVRIVGIDTSEDQLSKNNDLHERIVGDIQTYPTHKRYDMVICWTVLEHVKNPRKVLANLLSWTKPDGIIILSFPNVYSLKALITKCTPFWFHKWCYRNIFRYKNAPFPTYLRFSFSPRFVSNFFGGNKIEYSGFRVVSLRKPFNYLYQFVNVGLTLLTFGTYHPERSEFYIVIRKTMKP